ncbi:MAG: NADH-quinone oxidoreductase subunit C [Candidatus Acidiferrales bacterium]
MTHESKDKPRGAPEGSQGEKPAEPAKPTDAINPPVAAAEVAKTEQAAEAKSPSPGEEKPVDADAAAAAKPAAAAQPTAATAAPAKPVVAAGEKPPGAASPPRPAAPAAPAAKPAGAAGAGAAAPPKPPAVPKPGPVPLDNELVKRYRGRFGDAIREATEDRKQAILLVDKDRLLEIAQYTRDEEKFSLLADLTAVDWPKRERRFDVVLNLYSFDKNERLRIKTHAGEGEPVASMSRVWPTANWLERECFDMFGIVFAGHPELKRILLPDEWQGHPLRKDYDILQQDTAWVKENLGIESGQ